MPKSSRLWWLTLGMAVLVPGAWGKPPIHSLPPISHRTPVIITADTGETDPLGPQLAPAMSAILSKSPRFIETDITSPSGLVVHLVTLNPDKTAPVTVYGVTYTIKIAGGPEKYLSSTVAVCGKERISDCAQGMVDEVTHLADMMVQVIQSQPPPPSFKVPETYSI